MRIPIPCPKCNANLDDVARVTFFGLAMPDTDPEGQTRADLILRCAACGNGWNAFVALESFFENPLPCLGAA